MPKLKNCPICGKVFVDSGTGVCRDCYEEMQKMETTVLEYVRDHPKCKVQEIVEATGAKEKLVIRMIKQGRFIQSGCEISYPCEKCGKPIFRGKYCEECQKNLRQAISVQTYKLAAKVKKEKKSGQGMYSRDMGLH